MNVVKRCLVTGAGGFLGRFLLARLQHENILIRTLSRQPLDDYPHNIESIVGELLPDSICEDWLQGIDTVFYLAGTAHLSAASSRYETDHLAVMHFARRALHVGVQRFIFVSTTKAEENIDGSASGDDSYMQTTEPYAYWKRQTEKQLLTLAFPHLAIVRPCLVYGEGVKGNIQKMIQAIAKGYFPPLPEAGAQRSMVFAGDVANALWLVAKNDKANRQIFIASDEQPYATRALYDAIRMELGKPPVFWHIPLFFLQAMGRLGDLLKFFGVTTPMNSSVVSRLTENAIFSSAALQQLGWRSTTTFFSELPTMVASVNGKH